MELLELLFVLGVIAGLIWWARAMVKNLDKFKNPPLNLTSGYTWPEPDLFEVDIVGESHYQENIAAIAGEHGEDSSDKLCRAHLIPEDGNQHDEKAVRVDIDSLTVGYLDRDSARSFRRRLAKLKLTGQTTSCQAKLKGGFMMHDGNKASYGVLLDLKEFA